MFHGMRNRSISENALVDIFMKTMGQHLSSSWRLKAGKELPDGRRRVDFLLEIRDPEGAKATVVVEAKSQVDPRDVTRLVADGQRLGKADYFMVLAPFLARAQCTSDGLRHNLSIGQGSEFDPPDPIRVVVN